MSDALLPQFQVKGEGAFAIPGSVVPAPQAGDMGRDAAKDYSGEFFDCTELEAMRAWIRRAMHAEAFSEAMEKELDEHRFQAHARG